MKNILVLFLLISLYNSGKTQTFTRSQLPTELSTPWEMTYGPDGYLWLTEAGGTVSRVDPNTGAKTIVYVAPDSFEDSPLEQLPLCFMPNIGSGTLGLTLHPDFLNPANAFIYFLYSYNSGTASAPATKFKIAQLSWDWTTQSVTSKTDIVTGISTGYDHLGGRLMAIMRDDGKPYLFLSVGDHGISEKNSPDCYVPQSNNPNNQAQNPDTDNGKIHRFNIDGSIPLDNPIPGNSFYTRGHRNPQGLMYIPQLDRLFDVEHGDRTDDEVNLLQAGMNYGWKWVRGYHSDNNYPGEAQFIADYQPDPRIPGDQLVEAFYSFCAEPQPKNDDYLSWCTPAPSDGIYYNSDGIPEWKNSLLVVSLKNGTTTDNEVHVLKLTPGGELMAPSEDFFGADQDVNGRLRDIAVSPDGKKIFLINNGGEGIADKISIYTVNSITATSDPNDNNSSIELFPNPASDLVTLRSKEGIVGIKIYNLSGDLVQDKKESVSSFHVNQLPNGSYFAKINTASGSYFTKTFIKE
ncbi:MAG TPA: PQQ-dependent sugar dehydrogenase [Saprospiraceae bacterium]|nr:PQQ-dependent sugar dehydrogenase [Saprospiraceae bacterium]